MDMKKINLNSDKVFYLAIISICFLLFFSWSIIIPYNHAPDEHMRYAIPDFIYQYGKLPVGDDARIRNEIWGISYGFTPIFSYIISALFMKIVSIFSTSAGALLIAARFTSVCFSIGTVIFCIKIGKLLFDKVYARLFVCSIVFLPQFVFISSYVNNDAFGIFTVSWIIYAMLKAKANKWRLWDCIFLGIGIGLCLISYYNCYGIIIVALIYSVKSVIDDKQIECKLQFILMRVLWVGIAAFLVAGWWFIRNFILYDGDFLGMRASSECGELYAQDEFKPSNRSTPQRMGITLPQMLVGMRWLYLSLKSFVGQFDYLSLSLNKSSYYIIWTLFALGFLGYFIDIHKWRKDKEKYNNALLRVMMILMCAITMSLSIYYSYVNDFQAQGRYLLPMLISLSVLFVHSWYKLADKLFHEKRNYVAVCFICIYFMTIISATVDVIIPAYL